MRHAGPKSTVRWFVAAALLLFGLMVGGVTCPACNPDHLPARAEARAGSVQQSLQRGVATSQSATTQTSSAPPVALALAALLLAFVPARRNFTPHAALAVAASRHSSLWLTPYLFRPPPALLVR